MIEEKYFTVQFDLKSVDLNSPSYSLHGVLVDPAGLTDSTHSGCSPKDVILTVGSESGSTVLTPSRNSSLYDSSGSLSSIQYVSGGLMSTG